MNRIVIVSLLSLLVCSSALADFIVETRTGQQNLSQWAAVGVTATSSAKSSAAGCTTTGGSNYASTMYTGRGGRYSMGSQPLGYYKVYTTWGAGANRRANVRYTVTAGSGGGTYLIDQTQAVNTWYQVGGVAKFTSSSNNVLIDATFQSSGSLYLDGMKFESMTPGAVTLTSPSNGATNIPQTGAGNELTWTAGNYSSFFDVFMDLSASPTTNVGANLAEGTTSFDPDSLTLLPGTTYYWKVVAKNADKSTASAIWSFTTAPEPMTLAFLGLGSLMFLRRRRA